MYVVSGRGTVFVDRHSHELEPGTAMYLTAGESYEVENPAAETLLIVSATAPQANGSARPERRIVRYADQPPLLVHSLENSGSSPMRIVAVFHPAGDPASRAYEANE
jgi:mannose-6-phosphate isomerase-like protein (cupin superfamily)